MAMGQVGGRHWVWHVAVAPIRHPPPPLPCYASAAVGVPNYHHPQCRPYDFEGPLANSFGLAPLKSMPYIKSYKYIYTHIIFLVKCKQIYYPLKSNSGTSRIIVITLYFTP
jgi:hypothetical protein